jgi:hypothetical protein
MPPSVGRLARGSFAIADVHIPDRTNVARHNDILAVPHGLGREGAVAVKVFYE